MTYARNIAIALPLILIGGVFLLLANTKPSDRASLSQSTSPTAAGRTVYASEFVFRPFISDREETGVSFLAGNYPVTDHRLPRLELGESEDSRRLQVAMLIDWTNAECRMIFQLLHAFYVGAEKDSLPGIDLYLLPIHGDERGKLVHEAVMNVHFGSNQPDSLLRLVARLGDGTLTADDHEVQNFIAKVDPDLATRWDSLSLNLQDKYSVAFQLASAQRRYNLSSIKDATIPQLMVFDSVMIGESSPQSLSEFLRSAASRQHNYLSSPEGSVPVQIERGCTCEDPEHDHSGFGILPPNPPADGLGDSTRF